MKPLSSRAVATVATVATVAVIYVVRSKPVYKASARHLVIQQGGRPIQVGGSDPFSSVERTEESLATHLLLIRSPVIVERAVALSGLKNVSVPAVVANLTAKLSDPSAKILELGYKAQTADEARRVIDGIVESYKLFLKK